MRRAPVAWQAVSSAHPRSAANLPYAVFEGGIGVGFGDQILSLHQLSQEGKLEGLDIDPDVYRQPGLNNLLSHSRSSLAELRARLQQLVVDQPDTEALYETFQLSLPAVCGDFVDFYSSLEHATNVGTMFRGPERALNPNWRHLPVGYHGRCSTLQVSGQPVRCPSGQFLAGQKLTYGPSQRLDFELEVGFLTRGQTVPGQTLTPAEAEEYIFGLVLVNDWSARDIQKWEYVPLGPFLGKSFATTLSPWVLPLEALEPYRVEGPPQDPPVLPHLVREGKTHFNLPLEVELTTAEGDSEVVCRSNHRHLYWSIGQQLAHLTSNGTVVRPGDLCASGTISGPTPDSYGSMLELSWNGQRPVSIGSQKRSFLKVGDTVTLRGGHPGVGFGDCRASLVENGTSRPTCS